MPGELREDHVAVSDQKEGSQIYNRGNFGYPVGGGGVELDLIEALFLLEAGRLEVVRSGSPMSFEDLLSHSSSVVDGFDIAYIVYRDLRRRGFIVRAESGAFDLSVFPRGCNLSNSRPAYMVRAVSERAVPDISSFSGEASAVRGAGKQLLYGVVDEEGDLTYYIMSIRDPRGSAFPKGDPAGARGRLIRDRLFVFDSREGEALRSRGFYGKTDGDSTQLSLIEGCHLIGAGDLEVESTAGEAVSREALARFGAEAQDEFDLRLRAFEDLRGRGLVVKTGFKYGTHFRVYEDSPDLCHARYLVHAVSSSEAMTWSEISRAVRLSGGVKKEVLFCRLGESAEYLEFKWFRP
ncbi:MAG: tRNA-intron lyase [Candidatus Methanoplasma sp.]|jgi:tRNA-intron endonuclease|nr:tRNA-intron lyase [Candidatus Methanoplasma sp.]